MGSGLGFNSCDINPGMVHKVCCISQSCLKRRQFLYIFQRIARRNQTPDAIQLQAFEGREGHMSVAFMGWIEAASIKADTHARSDERQIVRVNAGSCHRVSRLEKRDGAECKFRVDEMLKSGPDLS